MLSKTRNILLGAGAAVAIGGYAYYKYAQNQLSFSIVGASISNIDSGVAQGNFTFKISNGTGISFNVLALNLNVYINNVFVGTIQQTSAIVVPANGSSVLQVAATLDVSKIESSALSSILSVITGGGISSYFDGYCTAQVNIPFLNFFNINIPVQQYYQLIGG